MNDLAELLASLEEGERVSIRREKMELIVEVEVRINPFKKWVQQLKLLVDAVELPLLLSREVLICLDSGRAASKEWLATREYFAKEMPEDE